MGRLVPRLGRWPTWRRHWLGRLTKSLRLFPALALAGLLFWGALACGSVRDVSDPTPEATGQYSVATDFTVVTPTSIEPPEGMVEPDRERENCDCWITR